jgi:hypothetical protein
MRSAFSGKGVRGISCWAFGCTVFSHASPTGSINQILALTLTVGSFIVLILKNIAFVYASWRYLLLLVHWGIFSIVLTSLSLWSVTHFKFAVFFN